MLKCPLTPTKIKKYLKSYKHEPGHTIKHYGKYDDIMPPKKHIYGMETPISDHVSDIFSNNNNDSGFNKLVNEIKERKYKSH